MEQSQKNVPQHKIAMTEFFLETMDAVSCGLKRRGTIQLVISGQFKSLYL
ncbi:hypothetical protein EXN66_Car020653 [Channa argus]|uniref:Uncharacterized protein n=1 Tax=Channa argus TaxID=215402 RepID=A0A6G1QQT6_CHAAH|nr:hypothetical protein EXN66_Car020653 [Channa argus]